MAEMGWGRETEPEGRVRTELQSLFAPDQISGALPPEKSVGVRTVLIHLNAAAGVRRNDYYEHECFSRTLPAAGSSPNTKSGGLPSNRG